MGTALGRILTLSLASALVASALVLGCSEEPSSEAPPEAPSAEAPEAEGEPSEAESSAAETEAEAVERAKRAAKRLGATLKGRLSEAMEEGGPAQAIGVCAEEAQELTRRIAEETGVGVGRSSLRLRNPPNRGPGWVRAWLEAQGERQAAGVEPSVEVIDGEARFVAPITVEGLCVTCHGPREAVPEAVRDVLGARYPNDQAVGYAPGDLRGAIWAAAPLP